MPRQPLASIVVTSGRTAFRNAADLTVGSNADYWSFTGFDFISKISIHSYGSLTSTPTILAADALFLEMVLNGDATNEKPLWTFPFICLGGPSSTLNNILIMTGQMNGEDFALQPLEVSDFAVRMRRNGIYPNGDLLQSVSGDICLEMVGHSDSANTQL